MPKKAEHELEVMLSDRQLMILFIIGVILLGAFFAMGYMAGSRWGGPAESPPVAQSGGQPAPRTETGSGSGAQQRPAAVSAPAPQTQEKEFVLPPPVSAPAAAAAPASLPERVSQAPGEVREPPPGQTFLQVSAQDWPNAQLLVDVLKQQQFPALIAPGPSPQIYRVLVGPLADQEQIARTRGDLQVAGFKPILRKY